MIRARRRRASATSLVLIGASTGRDGIGGASVLASAELGEGDDDQAPDRPDRRPVRGAKLLECCLELLERGPARLAAGPRRRRADLVGRRDGLARAGSGSTSTSPRCRCARPDMEPFEIMVSESQERMLARGRARRGSTRCSRVCEQVGDRRARAIGEVTDTRPPAGASTAASWSATCRSRRWSTTARSTTSSPSEPAERIYPAPPRDAGAAARRCATRCSRCSARPNIASRWAFEQYDSVVGSRTVRRPEQADAAVLQLPEAGTRDRGLDRRQRPPGRLRPVRRHGRGGARVRAEPRLRRRRAARPDQLPQLRQPREAARRLAARPVGRGPGRRLPRARRAGRRRQRLALQRERATGPIYPTPVVGMVGELPDAERAGRLGFAAGGRRDRAGRAVRALARRLRAGQAARRGAADGLPGLRPRQARRGARRCVRDAVRGGHAARAPTTSPRAASPARWPSARSAAASASTLDLEPLMRRAERSTPRRRCSARARRLRRLRPPRGAARAARAAARRSRLPGARQRRRRISDRCRRCYDRPRWSTLRGRLDCAAGESLERVETLAATAAAA